jgi:ABC-type amino acid transport substrate-binding protein
VGFRKTDRELCDQVNALIAKYKADGTFSALEKKYLG